MSKVKGYVYIATNPCFKAPMVKIGMTTKPVQERVTALYNTSIPMPFVLEHYWKVVTVEPRHFEKSIHKHLAKYRVNPSREYFSLEPAEAVKHVSNMLNSRGSNYKLRRRSLSLFKIVFILAVLYGLYLYASPYFHDLVSTISHLTAP